MPQVVVEEVAQTARRLQLGHVGVQIHAIDAADFERDVVTDNVGDVGRHQNLLLEIPVMVLLAEDTGHAIGPNVVFSQTAAQRPQSEGSPEVEGADASRPLPHGQWCPSLSWRFEAKLRCQPVVKVWTGCYSLSEPLLIRSLARIDPPYYTRAHGDGNPTQATTTTRAVGRRGRLADDGGASVLSAGERAAGRPPLRSVRRGRVPGVLRRHDGPPQSDAGHLFPSAVGRLL